MNAWEWAGSQSNLQWIKTFACHALLRLSLVYWHELTKKTLPFALKAAAKNRFIHTWLNRAQRQSSIKQNYAEIQLYELFKQHTDQQKVKVFWKLCGCQSGLHADVARGPHLPCACVFMSKQVALWHYISTWHIVHMWMSIFVHTLKLN